MLLVLLFHSICFPTQFSPRKPRDSQIHSNEPQNCSCLLRLITDQRDGNHVVTKVTDKQFTELLKRYLHVEVNSAVDDFRIRVARTNSLGSAAKQACRARTGSGARRRDTRQLS